MSTVSQPADSAAPAPVVELELVEEKKQLLAVAKQNALSAESADSLVLSFKPFFAEVHDLLEQAKRVEVTDATQVTMIRHARDLRLSLRKVRIAAENARVELKAESLRRGKAIDGMANIFKFMVEPVEEKLLAAEEFAERAEAKRREALQAARATELTPFVDDPSMYPLGDMDQPAFEKMLAGFRAAHEAEVAAKQKAEQERVEREKKEAEERERIRLENERLRREAAERDREIAARTEMALKLGNERQQHIRTTYKCEPMLGPAVYGELSDNEYAEHLRGIEARIEAERQKAEAERAKQEADRRHAEELKRKDQEAKERVERELAEQRRRNEEAAAKERQEREARELLERLKREAEAAEQRGLYNAAEERRVKAEAQAAQIRAENERRAADEKARQEAKLAEQRIAASAPDRVKLLLAADSIDALTLPELSTEEAQKIATTFADQRKKFSTWLRRAANTLGATQQQLNTTDNV